jgi:hypothetical protein
MVVHKFRHDGYSKNEVLYDGDARFSGGPLQISLVPRRPCPDVRVGGCSLVGWRGVTNGGDAKDPSGMRGSRTQSPIVKVLLGIVAV